MKIKKEKIKFELLYEGAIKPKIGTIGSAGYDISIPLTYKAPIIIEPGESVKINSGIAACMPKGIVLLLSRNHHKLIIAHVQKVFQN